jgi:uncharacterized protein YcaQ
MTLKLTKEEARNFLLNKQGLLGDYRYENKNGTYQFIRDVNAVQFDPIDVCGKNHELVLQSRVKNFDKKMVEKLLYEDRKLIDYYDKNMSIIPVKDWPYFSRNRENIKPSKRSKEMVSKAIDEIYEVIDKKGPVSSNELDFDQKVDWSWSKTRLSRAVLETLYYQGKVIVHHKNNTKKYYDLAHKHIDKNLLDAKDPNQSDSDYFKWYVYRRIKGIGLVYNLSSDAWLGIKGLKAKQRRKAFEQLINEKRLVKCQVEGLDRDLFMLNEDKQFLNFKEPINDRLEFIAPLDNVLWDRNLIFNLFDFHYRWEVYTPSDKREYGYYVLPVLHGDRFIGRIEIKCDRKNEILNIMNFWFENNIKRKKDKIDLVKSNIEKFALFNNCKKINYIDKKFNS